MNTIQILGIDGSPDSKRMQVIVKLAISSLGIQAVVENVTNLEELVKFNINGIPALVVNGNVILQKKVPELEEMKAMLKVCNERLPNPK